ncbi:hypothetical protein [Cohnella fermenti]|uniref:Uncharacterized protein n=1 Tax=Cohnella fermenti TaxID=2565925 RepID=A0A4V3WFY1_9BACL|nr:hypothetical protein [Cohnella fermenti]THF82142.1 hypothetical protein E6C55_07090 [Cohnella fermenti]
MEELRQIQGKELLFQQGMLQLLGSILHALLRSGVNSAALLRGGKTITSIRMKQEEPTAWIQDLANAVHAQQVSWDGKQEVYVLALPEGTIKITESVPAMGEHWANPQAGDLPMGPVYGVHDGKLVFLEFMIAQEDFINGVDHTKPCPRSNRRPATCRYSKRLHADGCRILRLGENIQQADHPILSRVFEWTVEMVSYYDTISRYSVPSGPG